MDQITLADVFRSDLFRTTTLTAAVNEIAYVPTRLAELGIFDVSGVPTTSIAVEKRGDTLALIPNTARGAPGTKLGLDRRTAVDFKAAHLVAEDAIYADEIQNVRAFGTGNQLASVEQTRDQRLSRMSRSIDLTLEFHRLGAIQGLVLDADGTTVIFDLFDKFGIVAPAIVDMNLDAAFNTTTGAEVIKPVVTQMLRDVDNELGGISPSGYQILCGDQFFDALQGHPEVRETLKYQQGEQLRADGRRTFTYGGAVWENYRGSGSVAIATTRARVVPLGVPELFQQVFSPADYMETVNTPGQVKYAKAAPDPSGMDKHIALEMQSNPITICTRPRALRELKLT